MVTIEKLRNSITGEQRVILNKIWGDYQEHQEWPTTQFLHRHFGRNAKVRLTLEKLGGCIVVEFSKGMAKHYQLTLLGILLVNEGEFWQKCFVNYLHYISDIWDKEPSKTRVNNYEIADALALTPGQSITFGELIRFSTLLSRDGSYIPHKEWEVDLPDSVDEFPEDLEQYFEQIILKDYDPHTPLSADKQYAYQMTKQQLEKPQQHSQPAQEDLLPMEIVRGTRGYIEHLAEQMNGCYRNGWYDACAVMARRLLEVLIIDSFEARGKLNEIRETDYSSLSSEVSEPPTVSDLRRFSDGDFEHLEIALRDVQVSLGTIPVGSPKMAGTMSWTFLTSRYPDWPSDILNTFTQVADAHQRGWYGGQEPALTKRELLAAKRGIVDILKFLQQQFPSAGISVPAQGDIVSLPKLIEHYLAAPDTYWHIERGARPALRRIREIGDLGAHSRYRKVIRQQLDKYQDALIAGIQQLVGTAYKSGRKRGK